jgi:hypothetical protein
MHCALGADRKPISYIDPWQQRVLASTSKRMILCTSRQIGKSQVIAARVLRHAMLLPNQTVVIVSKAQEQTREMYRKVMQMYGRSGMLVPKDPKKEQLESELHLANGSRILPRTGSEKFSVGYDPNVLVMDEAARIDQVVYDELEASLSATKGSLVVLSTPFGRRGWFWKEWEEGKNWERHRVEASESHLSTPEWLAQKREECMGNERRFRQAYMCSFEADTGSVFHPEDIDAAFRDELGPLWLKGIDEQAASAGEGVLVEDRGVLKIPGVD